MNPLDFKNLDDIKILSKYALNNVLPEKEYFTMQDSGKDMSDFIPLGENIDKIHIGSFQGENLIIQQGKSDIYLITDVNKFGFSMVHYILQHDNKKVTLSNSLPIKQLFTNKEVSFMNNTNVGNLAGLAKLNLNSQVGSQQQESYQATQPVAAQQPAYVAPPVNQVGTGMAHSSNVSRSQIATVARAFGYVIGYITQTGPQIKMKLAKTSTKKQGSSTAEVSYSIQAVESKPSKPIRVLAALPKGICMKEGRPASADEIYSCNIDFNDKDTDLAYFSWKQHTAVAFIGAVGKALPEFAPTHNDARAHYNPKDILENKVNMGYVEIVSRENRRRDRGNGEDYLWSLKSTARRSLFTPNNYLPLKQFQHIPIKCSNDLDAYNLNKIAFGGLDKKVPHTSVTRLETAYSECPQTIYKREYVLTEDGKEVKKDGIGSIYFMAGESDKVGDTEHPKSVLNYTPWYATAEKGKTAETKPVTRIVNKVEKASKSDPTKVSLRNVYITFAADYGVGAHKGEWKQYESFIRYIEPCISVDEIKALTSKDSSRGVIGGQQWSTDIQNSFLKLAKSSEVMSDHEAVAQKYSRDQLASAL